ncbi:hypothetical protein ACFV8Z_08685 [Streptomyces sp. NPDC059837]|uniref:hypothetical protein n=1 Tax=Streptomyces sp. NPDC059837 TaxID=3346968 RepID=UPI0036478978
MKKRFATLLAACTFMVGSSLMLGAGHAQADDPFTFEKSAVSSDGSYTIAAYYNGTYAGLMEWNADPIPDGTPGDAFRVIDRLSDGYGMEATMISPEHRVATTRGHSATYFSPWTSGNLTEDTKVFIQLCAVQGDYESCSIAYSGHA